MSDVKPDARDIFCAALERDSLAEQDNYVSQACGDDAEMRQRVEALLKADREAGSFLAEPKKEIPATANLTPISERPGTQIGRYKLLEQIGEGGFGVVYMAEQIEPVRR